MCLHHGEDSFVITSRQFGIHSCLQCDFQRLVHGPFLEIIMLFSSCSKDSLYPHPGTVHAPQIHILALCMLYAEL
jgi:hypothetical protein